MASNNRLTAKSNLHQQKFTKRYTTRLSARSPEVISRQDINIGRSGHLAHGKSTVFKAISRVKTVRFKNELERNITIRLERLSDSMLRLFRERADEKDVNIYVEKLKKSRTRTHPLDLEEDMPVAKKQKKGRTKESKEDYIVEIVDFQFENGNDYFYIKWKGFDDYENTWEPLAHLDNCPDLLKKFLTDIVHGPASQI